jgi:NADPH:quinone reductase-like Zn-dependent oxidoreductase
MVATTTGRSAATTGIEESGAMLATEIVLPRIGEPETLEVRQRELPAPGKGEVVVRVEATGVSFAEQSMRRGRYPAGQPRFPFVPGYDLVGTVVALGPGVAGLAVGQRVAALTKTGGWADHVILPTAELLPVRDGVDPAEVETLVVNGLTAWQMLHRKARVRAGQTVLVHGASGGVGTTLVQLARHAGIRVIGTAAPRHHEALRALGAEPLDYHDPDLVGSVRRLAPGGVDAAFDHLGLPSAERSFGLLAPGGTLVCYGMIAALNDDTPVLRAFAALLSRIARWNLLPNRRRATFYDLWGGHLVRRAAFYRRARADLARVLDLLAAGALTPQIAARLPLVRAGEALRLAESRTVFGKVVLIP